MFVVGESLKTPSFASAVGPFDFWGHIATWWEKKTPNVSEYTLQLSMLHDSVLTSGINEQNFLEMPSKGGSTCFFLPHSPPQLEYGGDGRQQGSRFEL